MSAPMDKQDNAVGGGAVVVVAAKPRQRQLNVLEKLWQYRKYMVIEVVLFLYVMPSILNIVAMANFPLDKGCRVNLRFNKAVCDTILDKGEIQCDEFTFEGSLEALPAERDVTVLSVEFNRTVCKAEVGAQKLAAVVSGRRAPIASVFTLVVLLFAGGWSDRYNKRKLCMILPLVGESLSFCCFFISALFFETIPMEVAAYLETIVPSMFGGLTLCLMAMYSYMTIATPPEDRIFRFAIFATFLSVLAFCQGASGWLFDLLGYTWSFAMALCFLVSAIFYIIFFIEEVQPQPVESAEAEEATRSDTERRHQAENLAYEASNLDDPQTPKNVSFEMTPPQNGASAPKRVPPKEDTMPVRRSFLREFFDPTLLMDCLKFPLKRRKNRGRLLFALLIVAYFLTIGPVAGENEYWYRYLLKELNWNGKIYSNFNNLVAIFDLVGTSLGTALFCKILKFSDPLIGLISASAIVLSRLILLFAKDTVVFFLGSAVNMLVSLRVIAIKSICASIIDGDELSKMFSVLGLSEPISAFIFLPVFSLIYENTVDSFPRAFILFSEVFYVLNVIVFIVCYFILRQNKARAAAQEAAKRFADQKALQTGGQNGHNNPAGPSTGQLSTNEPRPGPSTSQPTDCEVTSL